jgi:predicted alpha/beta hydrolase
MVGDLPAGVLHQWRRWCLDPEYAVGVEGPDVRALFASVTAPITAISFTDDELMSEASIASLHGFYTGTAVKSVRLAPEDAGLERIGHFGFFRPEMRAPLWESRLRDELAV